MNSRHWLTILRVCTIAAVLTSAALLVHYLTPAESGFCGPRSGCEAVRTSTLGSFGNQYFNIPVLGVVAYVVVLGLTFFPERRVLLKWVASAGGIVGIGFVLLQALGVGAFCWLCLVVDVLAVAIAFAAVALGAQDAPAQRDPLQAWAWWALATVAILAPVVWVQVKPNLSVPEGVAKLYKPGHFNVVEFSDYQCPHCRRLHPILKQQLRQLPEPKHFQRIHVPLPSHELSEDAARADICAALQGKQNEMADLLFELPLEDGIWFVHAEALGLDEARFKACLMADSTTEVLADHVDLFKAARLRGLPATFIGRETLMGAPAVEVIAEAFQKAQSPDPFSLGGIPYSLLVGGAAAVVVASGRRKENPTPTTGS